MPEISFSAVTVRGEEEGLDRLGEGNLLLSRGKEPFVFILGACRVDDGEEGERGPRVSLSLSTDREPRVSLSPPLNAMSGNITVW